MSLQQQMRPMLLVLVLMVETFALSSLVAIEVQQRTVTAVLATPARVRDFLAAKGAFGTGLAFTEVVLLALLIGALAANAPVILDGAPARSRARHGVRDDRWFLRPRFPRDVSSSRLLFMIPLMVPAFGALFPGSAATWIKLLPDVRPRRGGRPE